MVHILKTPHPTPTENSKLLGVCKAFGAVESPDDPNKVEMPQGQALKTLITLPCRLVAVNVDSMEGASIEIAVEGTGQTLLLPVSMLDRVQ